MYDIENSSFAMDILNSARFYFYINDYEKFDEMIEKLQDNAVPNGDDLIVRGWKFCYSNDINLIVNLEKIFFIYFTYVERR